TSFLDEIGDMPLNTQVKILRALETGEIERVGGHEKIPVDLRIVASTNKSLLQEIDKGNFRRDLYFRINTFTLNLPPLRERKEDILPLAQHFLDLHTARRGTEKKRLSRLSEPLLLNHDWPGNVRELRNAMERAVVLAAGSVVEPEVLPEEIRNNKGRPMAFLEIPQYPRAEELTPITPLRELERVAIIEALSRLGSNVTKTAKQLGISKATLFRKLKQYGISRQVNIHS
ncbi:MAG: sigma 54-interacting transcriptional regulator, partial [Candidatus Binatota bacterium]